MECMFNMHWLIQLFSLCHVIYVQFRTELRKKKVEATSISSHWEKQSRQQNDGEKKMSEQHKQP